MPLLRIWKAGAGRIEKKWMDEHIKIAKGRTIMFTNDLVDNNLNTLSWWTEKHNKYATREAIDRLHREDPFLDEYYDTNYVSGDKINWHKSLYMHLPLFVRPFLYFFCRYIIRLGFLEGKPGLIWHILQGFWFQFLVDAKIYQIRHIASKKGKSIKDVLVEDFDVKF